VSDGGMLELTIRGERLLLHPSRALLWPARRTAIVADVHFGKSEVFALHGMAVPPGADAFDRERLGELLRASGSERLLVLGDFLHGPIGQHGLAATELGDWLAGIAPVQVALVTGNHDRTAAKGWRAPLAWEGGELVEGPFRFVHELHAAVAADDDTFTFGGHLHPVVKFGAMRKRRPRLPVFWMRPHGMVLPSFGLFTGGHVVDPSPGERIFTAGPDIVLELRLPALQSRIR
jgi:uncharacterized protein